MEIRVGDVITYWDSTLTKDRPRGTICTGTVTEVSEDWAGRPVYTTDSTWCSFTHERGIILADAMRENGAVVNGDQLTLF